MKNKIKKNEKKGNKPLVNSVNCKPLSIVITNTMNIIIEEHIHLH